jgi:UDP-N-acetylglucosamine acyltransferase
MKIHSTAIVDPSAKLGPDVEIGAYAVIGPAIEVGEGTSIGSHAVVAGRTRIGKHNRIFQFVSLGDIPQDKKYGGEPTCLEIGDRNVIREFCTFNTGTAQDAGVTRLGDDNWIMAYVHLAHDCQVGSHTVFANNAQIAGHVQVGDYAMLGAFTVVHQFCHIAAHSLTAMGSIVLQDIPPCITAAGNPARPHGVNAEGLRRQGFDPEAIARVKRAYKTLFRSGLSLEEAKHALAEQSSEGPEAQLFLDFLRDSKRGFIR